MAYQHAPSVELIQDGAPPGTGRRRGRRWLVFIAALLLGLAAGATLVYSRTPVYVAGTSVLTVKPAAIGTPSLAADLEHVAIQQRLLLSEELLLRLVEDIAPRYPETSIGMLRQTLSARPARDTNLLDLRARGEDPQMLAELVNQWALTYEEYRADETDAATGRTTAELEDRERQLNAQITQAREDLAAYRRDHRIVGLEGGDNTALSELRGLNQSLSEARAKLIEARAQRSALREAATGGEPVAPPELRDRITALTVEVSKKQAELDQLLKKYTRLYIDSDPKYKELPGELESARSALNKLIGMGRRMAMQQAEQEVQNAAAEVKGIEEALVTQRQQVQQFDHAYQEYKLREENLNRLEGLQADNAEQLAAIKATNLKRFPPIRIVDWAGVPSNPVWPDYQRDLLIALGSAFGLALFLTWLVDYLDDRSRRDESGPNFGVNIYTGEQAPALAQAGPAPGASLGHAPGPALAAPPKALTAMPRELGGVEIKALLQAADPQLEAHITLLLNGVAPFELALLQAASFSPEAQEVGIPGHQPRRIRFHPAHWARLQALLQPPVALMAAQALDHRLMEVAQAAQLASPGAVNALALWHTYLLYLARQGIDDETLSRRVGHLPGQLLQQIHQFSPEGGTDPAALIDFDFPALS